MPGTVRCGYPASSLLRGFQRFLSSAYLLFSEIDTTFYTTCFLKGENTIRFAPMVSLYHIVLSLSIIKLPSFPCICRHKCLIILRRATARAVLIDWFP